MQSWKNQVCGYFDKNYEVEILQYLITERTVWSTYMHDKVVTAHSYIFSEFAI